MNKRLIAGAVSAMVLASAMAFAGDKDKAAAEKKPVAAGNAGAPAKPPANDMKKEEPAKPEMKMEMPKPAQQTMDAAKAMKGTWNCKGTVKAMMGMPEHAMVATMTWKPDLDNFWLTGTFTSKKTKDDPMPYSFVTHRAYNTAAGKWVSVNIDNMGMMTTGTGTGDDKKMVWESKWDEGGQTMMSRETAEVVSAKEHHILGEMSMDGKQWMPAWELTCKK